MLESPAWSGAERRALLLTRLRGIHGLAASARVQLRDGRPRETRRAIERLRESGAYLRGELTETVEALWGRTDTDDLLAAAADASRAVTVLAARLDELLPQLTLPDEPILGRDVYAHKLANYTDSGLTPEALEELAWGEIQASKRALAELAAVHWRQVAPGEPVPEDFDALIARAFDDLESNRPVTEQPYLEELRRYGREVEAFVRDHEIATVPEHQTLSIELT